MSSSSVTIVEILQFFWKEFLTTNEKLFNVVVQVDKSRPFADWNIYLLYAIYGVVTYGLVVLNCNLLARFARVRWAMYLVLLLNVPMVLTALLLPSGSVNFFLAVQTFTYLMNMQGRALVNLQKHDAHHKHGKTKEDWWAIYTSVIYFGVPSRVELVVKKRLPSFAVIYHGLYIMIVSDFTNYLIYEYVPYVISPANQNYAKALLGTVWLLFALEFAYWNLNMGFNLFGMPLSPKLLHKNPLLSSNVTRFWGVNWNPIIGKLLQDSFYLPFIRMGLPKWICAVTCFIGSGLFHAVPYFISRLNLERAQSVLVFFLIQAVGIIIEAAVDPILRLPKAKTTDEKHTNAITKQSKSKSNGKKSKKAKSDKKQKEVEKPQEDNKVVIEKNQVVVIEDPEAKASEYAVIVDESNRFFRIEIGFMFFLITVMNAIYEVGWEAKNLTAIIILGGWSISEIMKKHIKAAKKIVHKRKGDVSFWSVFIRLLIGWIWTIAFIMASHEFFIPPMIEVLGQFYDKACMVGPVYRTIMFVVSQGKSS